MDPYKNNDSGFRFRLDELEKENASLKFRLESETKKKEKKERLRFQVRSLFGWFRWLMDNVQVILGVSIISFLCFVFVFIILEKNKEEKQWMNAPVKSCIVGVDNGLPALLVDTELKHNSSASHPVYRYFDTLKEAREQNKSICPIGKTIKEIYFYDR